MSEVTRFLDTLEAARHDAQILANASGQPVYLVSQTFGPAREYFYGSLRLPDMVQHHETIQPKE